MISYTCKNCGAQMELGEAGSFICPYCESRSFLSDKDFRENKEFRKKLLAYYKAKNDEQSMSYETDTLWECIGMQSFTTSKGQTMNIEYMDKVSYKKCICYIAKESIVYVFEDGLEANQFMAGLHKLVFPEADSKLYRSFPELKTIIELEKGKAIVFVRRPHFYPVKLFMPMEVRHVAWVISRMENICCALEYSNLQHNGITLESLFVNVKTHEGALFGDWREVGKKFDKEDLFSVRLVAKTLVEDDLKPVEFIEFLNSKPKDTAFDDFSYWDTVIEKGFGGHNFIKYE